MGFNNRAKKEVIKYLKENKTIINVVPGTCRYNFRCQLNAVHDAIENGEDKLALCMYIEDDYPIIHFINYSKEGEYVDNTLGHWSSIYDYYFIKFIDKEDFFEVRKIFTNFRKEIRDELSFFTKLFSDIVF